MALRKAVIPAAGLGTDFLPATLTQPKEMLPLVDKPMIQYAIEEAAASGLAEILIVTGRGKRAIEDHFDSAFELEHYLTERHKLEELRQVRAISELANLYYVRQTNALGLGDAVLSAGNYVGEEPFAILLADHVIEATVPCMRQLLEVHEQYGEPVLAVQRVDPARVGDYGVVAGEQTRNGIWRITKLVEKPKREDAPSNLGIVGRYILTPDIMWILKDLKATRKRPQDEIQLTDGLQALLETRPIYAVEIEGKLYDTGDKLGFLKATVEFALRRNDLGEPFLRYLKSLGLSGAQSR